MNFYFGNVVTIIATVMVCTAIAYIIYTAIRHKKIELWGRRVALLALFGLVLCCFVVTRDDYHLSVQSTFDSAVAAGVFSINSLQSILCCIGGAVIALSSLSCVFVKNQKYRKTMFFILAITIIVKTFVIEISRWLV